jgi:hypothetical protein
MSLKTRLERVERRLPPRNGLADLTDLELAAALAAGYRQQIEQGGLSDEERASAVAELEEIEALHTPHCLAKAWESALPVITRFFELNP